MIECIFDTTPDKINKVTPGTHIPIKNHKYFKNLNINMFFYLHGIIKKKF